MKRITATLLSLAALLSLTFGTSFAQSKGNCCPNGACCKGGACCRMHRAKVTPRKHPFIPGPPVTSLCQGRDWLDPALQTPYFGRWIAQPIVSRRLCRLEKRKRCFWQSLFSCFCCGCLVGRPSTWLAA